MSENQNEEPKRKTTQRKKVDATTVKIGFIGAGKTASCIINGLVTYAKIEPKRIFVSAPSSTNSDSLKQTYSGLHVTKRNIDIFGRFNCDVVFICVTGNVIRNLYKMGGVRPVALTTNYIPNMRHPIYVLSLVTGFTCYQLKECLLNPDHPEKYRCEIHRIVMNCAAAYGMGMCLVDVEPDSKKLSEIVRNILSPICRLEYLPESQMDAACALLGSGLAFCYYFINAISEGALKIGFNRTYSVKFAAKVANVASQTLLETGKNPSELKDETCAPSAAAIYGISVLEKGDVGSGFSAGIEAAYKRAEQISANGV